MGGVCSPVVGMAQPNIISLSSAFDDLPADALEPAHWCNPKSDLPAAAHDAGKTESFLRAFAKRRRQSYHPGGRAAPELLPPAPPLLPTTTPPPLPRRAISPPAIVRRPATARVAGEHPAPLLPEMKNPVLAESVSAPRAWAPSRPPPVRTSSSASGGDLRRIAAAAAFLARSSAASVDELLGDIRIDDDDDLDRISFSSWAADCDPTSPRTPTSSFVC